MRGPEPWPVMCSANPLLPAAAYCSECQEPHSGKFLSVRRDGRAICFACARRDGTPVFQRRTVPKGADPVLGGGFARTLLAMFVAPHRALVAPGVRAAAPLLAIAFGFSLLGYGFTLGWTYLLSYEAVVGLLREQVAALPFAVSDGLLPWLPWVAWPFVAAVRVLLGATTLHLTVRLANPNDADWRETLRVWALSSALLMACVLPLAGTFVSMVLWISAMLGWFRVRHGLGPIGSLFAVLPSIVVLSLVGPNPLA